MSKRRAEIQRNLLARRTRAQAVADKHAARLHKGLKRCVVYVPEHEKERLGRYVVQRLGGEYQPR